MTGAEWGFGGWGFSLSFGFVSPVSPPFQTYLINGPQQVRMAGAFDAAWDEVKKSDASMYCEDVFMAMESHGLRYSQALRQVAELVGVDKDELAMACQEYRESGGQTKDFGLRGRV